MYHCVPGKLVSMYTKSDGLLEQWAWGPPKLHTVEALLQSIILAPIYCREQLCLLQHPPVLLLLPLSSSSLRLSKEPSYNRLLAADVQYVIQLDCHAQCSEYVVFSHSVLHVSLINATQSIPLYSKYIIVKYIYCYNCLPCGCLSYSLNRWVAACQILCCICSVACNICQHQMT